MPNTPTPEDMIGTETCAWCKGDGKDHSTLGMAQVRDCSRCEGSGRVRVAMVRGQGARRRSYIGPAPSLMAAQQQQQLTETIQKRKPGRPKKQAHA